MESVIPIKRAQMRLLVVFSNEKQLAQFQDVFDEKFKGEFTKDEVKCENPDNYSVLCSVEPHLFRGINDIFSGSKEDKKFYSKCHV